MSLLHIFFYESTVETVCGGSGREEELSGNCWRVGEGRTRGVGACSD